MPTVEQALFAMTETDRATGYRVVAQSHGVREADARELAVWGPTHDSMLDWSPEAESFNFHPLPSGAYCISRTRPVAQSSAGPRVATHCLIARPETLARFGNNPFTLIRAASAERAWFADAPGDSTWAPLTLSGGAAPVDLTLLGELAADPGPENMAALVQAARESVCLAVDGTPSPRQLIAGLFSCLPPECRLEFSFSTGLKFSPRRPFRIVALSGDSAERQWMANYSNVVVFDARAGQSPPPMPLDGWARWIQRAMAAGRIDLLAAQVSKRRFHLAWDDLPALGLQLQEELDDSELSDFPKTDADFEDSPMEYRPRREQQAHAAHHQFAKSMVQVRGMMAPSSSLQNSAEILSPVVLEKLEQLDDLVYEAISGQSDMMEQLRVAWPKLLAEVGESMLAESREQYLRYALSIWEECVDGDNIRDPLRAIQALDVICLLFGDAQ